MTASQSSTTSLPACGRTCKPACCTGTPSGSCTKAGALSEPAALRCLRRPLMQQLHIRWGQHMHHGYYEPGKQVSNQQAQIDMIERTLDWAGITAVTNVSIIVQ